MCEREQQHLIPCTDYTIATVRGRKEETSGHSEVWREDVMKEAGFGLGLRGYAISPKRGQERAFRALRARSRICFLTAVVFGATFPQVPPAWRYQ